jgi:hypothetical protein
VSSISRTDFRFIEELIEFLRGRGYVLDLSDATFSEFFADELNVDLDDPVYAVNGGSKGKRLRTFLSIVDNDAAARSKPCGITAFNFSLAPATAILSIMPRDVT